MALVIVSQSFGQDTTQLNKTLNPILVIGIRADGKTPVSQKTLKREEIQKNYQGQEVPIVLDKTPSITSASDGGHPQGYTYFRLRGMDQSRINMTLNGVPLNEPEDQGVYTSNYPGFTNIIQSMQVQRGVGTSTNGVASYAGSINFQSLTGLENTTEGNAGYGSFNTKRFNGMASTGLSKRGFALVTNISGYSSDGYKYNSGGNGLSSFVSGGYYGDKDVIRATVFNGQAINGMAWLAVSESDIKKDPRTNYNQHDASDNFKQSFYQLQYTRTFSPYTQLSTTIFYTKLDGSYDYFSSGKRSVVLGSNFYGVISNFQYDKNKIKFNLGVDLNNYNRDHTNYENHSADYGIGSYTNEGVKNEFSAFAKLNYDLNKFTLFGDAQYRYTDFKYEGNVDMKKLTWNFFNPKIGLIYNEDKTLNYYASFGMSKREPTRTNLFGGQDNLTTLLNIKPEEVMDYELGLNLNETQLHVQANIYYMDFKNEITLLGALGSNGLPLMTNVTQSFRSGLELDFIYKSFLNILTFSTNLNYSYNQIKDNKITFEPLYTPKLVANQVISFDFKGISIGLMGKYQSLSYISFDNRYTSPAFVTLGTNLGYTFKNFTLSLQANNLTNNKYYTSGYVINNEKYFFVNPPANFYGTLKYRF